nr:PREDICTED: MORC family CW-type zinc finger protein 3 isoform X1 [Latimeria chalumnae]|eukprot:XP_014345398.1 PREDICTED: MORC family CW-type zinc finger protein 3 isoform X1 [Latimeria chalumnae]
MSIGLLSQTYLEAINAKHVIVPIVTYDQQKKQIPSKESEDSLKAILGHSLFSDEKALLAELDAVMGRRGTRIIIWSIRQCKGGKTEFDFDTDKYDIRIPDDFVDEKNGNKSYRRQERMDQIVPESDYSLRAYCSILYLKPRMQIILRGQKVKTQLVSKNLAHIERDVYKPQFLTRNIKITFGFNWKNKEHYGIMMYHKNRLIKAYERVGCQLRANNMGVGVIGVIECSFLKPTHNKQDFDYTKEYRLTISALGQKLNDYWNEKKANKYQEDPQNTVAIEDEQVRPDQNWVQCDSCLKWRKLPDGINPDKLPDKWYCWSNPDPQYRSCDVPEEPEDEDLHPTYEKTYKKQERVRERRLQEQDRTQNTNLQRFLSNITQEAEALRKDHDELKKRLRAQVKLPCPSLPASSPSKGVPQSMESHLVPTADFGMSLMVTNVVSLSAPESTPDSNSKRRLSMNSSNLNAKKQRLNDDDDVIILDEKSTPRPKETLNLSKVKIERKDSVETNGFHMECVEEGNEENADRNGERCVAVTQTETSSPVIKREEPTGGTSEVKNGSKEETQSTPCKIVNKLNTSAVDCSGQLDELKNKLHSETQEKEQYRNQYTVLLNQVKKLEAQLSERLVKKEVNHQSTETDFKFPGNLSKSSEDFAKLSSEEMVVLHQQTAQEMEKLKEQCHILQNLKSDCCKCALKSSEVDEMVEQLDNVFRQLDKCSTEKDEYKNKLEELKQEEKMLLSECARLRTEAENFKSQVPESAGENSTADGSANSAEEKSIKLRSLRVNVGQLLCTFVPDLDLNQVNYDCEVIDEILEQVLGQIH